VGAVGYLDASFVMNENILLDGLLVSVLISLWHLPACILVTCICLGRYRLQVSECVGRNWLAPSLRLGWSGVVATAG
jgi:hypothetical protein